MSQTQHYSGSHHSLHDWMTTNLLDGTSTIHLLRKANIYKTMWNCLTFPDSDKGNHHSDFTEGLYLVREAISYHYQIHDDQNIKLTIIFFSWYA